MSVDMMKTVIVVMSICATSFGFSFRKLRSDSDVCQARTLKITCTGQATNVLNKGYLHKKIEDQTILEISESDISTFKPEWTKGTNTLTWLKINFNEKLTTLSNDSFIYLKNLEKLDLSYNNISSLNVIIFFPLVNLTSIRLEHNRLQILQTGLFSRQRYLKVLKLSYNKIKTLDSVVLNPLMNLEELYINHNELDTLDGRCFNSLEKLRVLDLSTNHLKVLPDTIFNYQKKLEMLNLDTNNFTTLNSKALVHLHRIKNFTFANNMVSNVDLTTLKVFGELRSFDFSGTAVNCDCSAKNFYEWASERSVQLNLSCKIDKTGIFLNASEYLPQMDCSIVERPRLGLLIILGLLLVSVIVDIFVSWVNYKYDLTVHRASSSVSVNEYEYVDNFNYLEAKVSAESGVRDSGRYQSVLQKVMSVYDYLRPLPGRRYQDSASTVISNPSMPEYQAPAIPPR